MADRDSIPAITGPDISEPSVGMQGGQTLTQPVTDKFTALIPNSATIGISGSVERDETPTAATGQDLSLVVVHHSSKLYNPSSTPASCLVFNDSHPTLTPPNYEKFVERGLRANNVHKSQSERTTSKSLAENHYPMPDSQQRHRHHLTELLQTVEQGARHSRNLIDRLEAEKAGLEQSNLESMDGSARLNRQILTLEETATMYEDKYHAERRQKVDLEQQNSRLKQSNTHERNMSQAWRTRAVTNMAQLNDYREKIWIQRRTEKEELREAQNKMDRMENEFKTRLFCLTLEKSVLQGDLDEAQTKLTQLEHRLTKVQERSDADSCRITKTPIEQHELVSNSPRSLQTSPIPGGDTRQDTDDNEDNTRWIGDREDTVDVLNRFRIMNPASGGLGEPRNNTGRSIPETTPSMVNGDQENIRYTESVTPVRPARTFARSSDVSAPIIHRPGTISTYDRNSSTMIRQQLPCEKPSTDDARDSHAADSCRVSEGAVLTNKRRRLSDHIEHGSSHDGHNEQSHPSTKRRTNMQCIENKTIAARLQEDPSLSIPKTKLVPTVAPASDLCFAASAEISGEILASSNSVVDDCARLIGTTRSYTATDSLEATCTIKLVDLFSDTDLEPPMNLFQVKLRAQLTGKFKMYLLHGQGGGAPGVLNRCCLMRFKKKQTMEAQPQTVCLACERLGSFCLRMDTTKDDRVTVVPLQDTIRSGRRDEIGFWVQIR